ncbi:hypothetical protein ACFL0X_01875 [Nanoarchaeota archaeon]
MDLNLITYHDLFHGRWPPSRGQVLQYVMSEAKNLNNQRLDLKDLIERLRSRRGKEFSPKQEADIWEMFEECQQQRAELCLQLAEDAATEGYIHPYIENGINYWLNQAEENSQSKRTLGPRVYEILNKYLDNDPKRVPKKGSRLWYQLIIDQEIERTIWKLEKETGKELDEII